MYSDETKYLFFISMEGIKMYLYKMQSLLLHIHVIRYVWIILSNFLRTV